MPTGQDKGRKEKGITVVVFKRQLVFTTSVSPSLFSHFSLPTFGLFFFLLINRFSFQWGILGDVGQIRKLCIFWQILGYSPVWLFGRMTESRENERFECLKCCKYPQKLTSKLHWSAATGKQVLEVGTIGGWQQLSAKGPYRDSLARRVLGCCHF